jgi:ubiquinone/menaquinone biosynthesis C-methylase UbiE
MDTPQLNGSERTYWNGSEVRGDRILAANPDCCVEESYPVAYNLGCGKKHWDGWINVDYKDADLNCDLRKLEIQSDTADAVAAIHVLEHFHAWEAPDLITEWRRVLKPGGKMILELPCMDKVFAYVSNCIQQKQPLMEFMSMFALWGDPKYKDVAMCHKWGYFQATLRSLLEYVGMREIQFVDPRYHFMCRDMLVEAIK